MSNLPIGLIQFGIMFFWEYCKLRKFSSPLRGNTSFSFGFQNEKNTIYDFDELTKAISEREFPYNYKVGLFVQNNKTQRREIFNITIPPKLPGAEPDKTLQKDGYELDITEILERVSKRSE